LEAALEASESPHQGAVAASCGEYASMRLVAPLLGAPAAAPLSVAKLVARSAACDPWWPVGPVAAFWRRYEDEVATLFYFVGRDFAHLQLPLILGRSLSFSSKVKLGSLMGLSLGQSR
jgi:hypothetical protein